MIVSYVSKIEKDCYDSLKGEFTDVKNFISISDFINFYAASKNRDVVLLYRVESLEDVAALTNVHFTNNIYMILIGDNSTEYSLEAGKIGVDKYLSEEEANPEAIKNLIIKSQGIIKTRRGNSNISVFTGINGGVGTTSIVMNLAKSLSQEHPEKNVLFLDFSYTKAISNLFFDLPQPKKTIVDIATVQNIEMQELFENGLEKLSDNFYFIPGIQKHTEKEELEKPQNIQVFLNFIMYIKEKFDYILITTPPHQHTYILEVIQFADKTILVTTINKMSIYFTDKFLSIFSKLTDDISLLITEEDVDNEIYKILNQEFSDIEKIKDFKIK